MAHLLGGKVNLALLRESARTELRQILKTNQTKKVCYKFCRVVPLVNNSTDESLPFL